MAGRRLSLLGKRSALGRDRASWRAHHSRAAAAPSNAARTIRTSCGAKHRPASQSDHGKSACYSPARTDNPPCRLRFARWSCSTSFAGRLEARFSLRQERRPKRSRRNSRLNRSCARRDKSDLTRTCPARARANGSGLPRPRSNLRA